MFSSIKKLYKNEESFRATILVCAAMAMFLYLFYKLSPMISPFICAILLSAIMNPLISKWQKIGVPRWLGAAALIILIIISLIILCIILSFFVQKYFIYYGEHINSTISFMASWVPKKITEFAARLHIPVEVNSEKIVEYLRNSFGLVTNLFMRYVVSIFGHAKSVVSLFSFVFIVPILTFYILKDWQKLVSKTKQYTPNNVVSFAEFAFPQAKAALINQLKGQMRVCLILFLFYTVFLYFIGIKPFFLLGVISGISTFMPFIGILIAFLLVFAAAVGQSLGILPITLIFVFYFVGSSIESNFLTPKFVGEKIGLHPVWILFAVLAALLFLGIAGAFFIMPIATIVWSLIRSTMQWLNKIDEKDNQTSQGLT